MYHGRVHTSVWAVVVANVGVGMVNKMEVAFEEGKCPGRSHRSLAVTVMWSVR